LSEEGPQGLITRLGLARRDPVSRDRYRALARKAGVRRPSRLLLFDGALISVLVVTALVALPRVAAGIGEGASQLVASIESAVPLLQGQSTIELPSGGASTPVGAAPIVEGLPLFTRDPQLQFSGRVPSFAVQEGRSLQVVLNGAVLSTTPVDPTGTFSAALALREGANTITLNLVEARDLVATSSYSVTLDRTPPTLTISTPPANATIDAQNVIVRGLTEVGATLTVNGRSVIVSPDGSFADFSSAPPGPLAITIVARDRAGNETTQQVNVIAQQITQATGVTVNVTLDKSTVRPGQAVLATITVVGPTGPRAGVPVTLSVGVVTIGSAVTDATGTARIGFAAPSNEGDASVVVLAAGTSGRAPLTISAH
jgi:glucodextranase-like protein